MFFFGFLSSIFPYAATLVLMGLYLVIGTPTQPEAKLDKCTFAAIEKQDTPSLVHYTTFEITKECLTTSTQVRQKAISQQKALEYQAYHSPIYSSCYTSNTSNKAPPVLA